MDSNGVTAIATVILVLVTAYYARQAKKTVDEMQKSREIEFIEKKFENFYLPIQNALKSVVFHMEDKETANIMEMAYANEYSGQVYEMEKADVLDNALKEVINYNYLASPELRELINKFSKYYGSFNNPSTAGEAVNEVFSTRERIEKMIDEDIKENRKNLKALTTAR